jgi:hypothetical protein
MPFTAAVYGHSWAKGGWESGQLYTPEIVFESFDIILAEICAGLGFNEYERFGVMGVLNSVGNLKADIDGISGRN